MFKNICNKLKNTLRENKGYWICEAIIFITTTYFIYIFNLYNKVLHNIQNRYKDEILKMLEVAKEPSYFNYLFLGGFVILIIMGYTFIVIKKLQLESVMMVLINIILLIVFLIIYRNPILVIFSALLIIGGVLTLANS